MVAAAGRPGGAFPHIRLWITIEHMKTIQITIEEELLAALDRTLKGTTRRRSAFIRQSIAGELKRLKHKRLEEIDRRGYQAGPVEPGEFDVEKARLAWGGEWRTGRNRVPGPAMICETPK